MSFLTLSLQLKYWKKRLARTVCFTLTNIRRVFFKEGFLQRGVFLSSLKQGQADFSENIGNPHNLYPRCFVRLLLSRHLAKRTIKRERPSEEGGKTQKRISKNQIEFFSLHHHYIFFLKFCQVSHWIPKICMTRFWHLWRICHGT